MVDFALSRFSNRMSRRMMPRGGEVLWDLQLVWCWLSVSFQLVKEFDVIHTPNQVGDLCSLCLPQSGQLPSRPACPPALCFSTCRCVGWMQKALLLFLNSSLWHGQFCSVCLTCRCCCSSYWNGLCFTSSLIHVDACRNFHSSCLEMLSTLFPHHVSHAESEGYSKVPSFWISLQCFLGTVESFWGKKYSVRTEEAFCWCVWLRHRLAQCLVFIFY